MDPINFKKFFNQKKPSGAITSLIIGIIAFVFGIFLDNGVMWALIGLVLVCLGVFLLIRFNSAYSYKSVDNFCNQIATEYFNTKETIVHSKFEAITSVFCNMGYSFENLFTARKALICRDGKQRSSILDISCVFFTNSTVYYFNKKVSLLTNEVYENQKDFYFHDIQLVSIEEINQSFTVSITIPGNNKIFLKCKTKEEALELSDKIKNKMNKGNQHQ